MTRLALLPLMLLLSAPGGCRKPSTPTPPVTAEDLSPPPPSEEGCLDAWLQARSLDAYGAPQGTMYAGGTPLFDEATGEQKDRREYVYARHPEAREACGSGDVARPGRVDSGVE